MVWAIVVAPSGVLRAVIALLCAIVWFGCWRLWLDARYFSLLNVQNNVQAGEALYVIWQRDKLRTLSLTERRAEHWRSFGVRFIGLLRCGRHG